MSRSLLDEFGLDPEDFEWQDLALCANMPVSFFYDLYESDREVAKATDQVCLRCPVIRECFFAGANGEHGVWGGFYWNGSGEADTNKNSHKTEEVKEEILRRVS
jgi:hypothetical protein